MKDEEKLKMMSEAIFELSQAIIELKEHQCGNSGYNWFAEFYGDFEKILPN